MRKIFLLLLVLVLLATPAYALKIRAFTVLTGGGTGSLDKVSSVTASLTALDSAIVVTSDGAYFYTYDAASSATEVSPDVIMPDNAPATGRWVLVKLFGDELQAKKTWGSDITGNISLTTSAANSKFYQVTAVCTITLDAAADVGYGAAVTFFIRDAAEVITIDVDGSDKINVEGVALAAGNTIDSPGLAGDWITLVATTDADGSGTDGWMVCSTQVWVDGGAT